MTTPITTTRVTTTPTEPSAHEESIMKVKAEVVIAELNRLRGDVDKDPTDPEYFALHHALCFISYKMGEFQRYLDETVKDGEHP
ncbi:MAG: hypothetical protein RI967_1448 [Planctomycetota bacterium]